MGAQIQFYKDPAFIQETRIISSLTKEDYEAPTGRIIKMFTATEHSVLGGQDEGARYTVSYKQTPDNHIITELHVTRSYQGCNLHVGYKSYPKNPRDKELLVDHLGFSKDRPKDEVNEGIKAKVKDEIYIGRDKLYNEKYLEQIAADNPDMGQSLDMYLRSYAMRTAIIDKMHLHLEWHKSFGMFLPKIDKSEKPVVKRAPTVNTDATPVEVQPTTAPPVPEKIRQPVSTPAGFKRTPDLPDHLKDLFGSSKSSGNTAAKKEDKPYTFFYEKGDGYYSKLYNVRFNTSEHLYEIGVDPDQNNLRIHMPAYNEKGFRNPYAFHAFYQGDGYGTYHLIDLTERTKSVDYGRLVAFERKPFKDESIQHVNALVTFFNDMSNMVLWTDKELFGDAIGTDVRLEHGIIKTAACKEQDDINQAGFKTLNRHNGRTEYEIRDYVPLDPARKEKLTAQNVPGDEYDTISVEYVPPLSADKMSLKDKYTCNLRITKWHKGTREPFYNFSGPFGELRSDDDYDGGPGSDGFDLGMQFLINERIITFLKDHRVETCAAVLRTRFTDDLPF